MGREMTNDFVDLRSSKKDSLFIRETYEYLPQIVQSLEIFPSRCDHQLMRLFRPSKSKLFYLNCCVLNQLFNYPVNLKLFYRSVVLLSIKNIFSYLHTIDICNNTLTDLPDEFCSLVSLKECYLSHNKMSYLPYNLGDLRSLNVLHLNSNNLRNLPASIGDLSQLTELDLYDNDIREFPRFPESIMFLDVAQNYVEEPEDIVYWQQREKLRYMLGYERKSESKIFESDFNNQKYYESDEEYEDDVNSNYCDTEVQEEEDWETDEYWDPSCRDPSWPDARTVWENFVSKVQDEGGFVPSDMHVLPTEARISAVKLPVVPGQFDDD